MNRHVVLLGDLKGTKSLLSCPSYDKLHELERRIELMQSCFAKSVLIYLERSRSMVAATFSDSLFVRWDDHIEGRRIAPEFAMHLWNLLTSAGLPMRIFIDEGGTIPERDDLGNAIGRTIGRFNHITAVSTAVWSVFVAEESHFPESIFIGKELKEFIPSNKFKISSTPFDAGPFQFFEIKP